MAEPSPELRIARFSASRPAGVGAGPSRRPVGLHLLTCRRVTASAPRHTAGRVHLGRKEINKLIGEVFIHRSAVNLLSTVLDTPEFFWSAPDSLQSLYRCARERCAPV